MSGIFVNGVKKKCQGMTDFGYYTEERGFNRKVSELENLVEVFETENFGFHIRLKSENRRVSAETEGKIEKKGRRLGNSLYQTTEEPKMPGEYEGPHQAVEAYAEYALEHGRTNGISMDDVDWDSLLEEQRQK